MTIKEEIAEELIRKYNPTRVLDVGCGDNELTSYFKKSNIEAVGIDIKRKPDIRANAEHLPFKANSFDLITSMEVVEHLPNPITFIKEARRILINGGYIYITTPTPLKDLVYRVFFPTTDIINHIGVKHKAKWVSIFDLFGFILVDDTRTIEKRKVDYFCSTKPSSAIGRLLGAHLRRYIITLQRYILFKITIKGIFRLTKHE